MNIYRLKKIFRNHFENGFSFYFVLFLIFIFGIIIGAVIIKALSTSIHYNILKYSNPYFFSNFKNYDNYYNIFKMSIYFNLIYIGISYVFGILNLGFIIPVLVFIKGGTLGFTVGFLLHNFSWKGFIISIFGCYPQYLIYIPCIVAVGALSMTVAAKYKFSANRKFTKFKRLDILEYTLFVLFFTVLMIIGSIYEGFISPIFLNIIKDLV